MEIYEDNQEEEDASYEDYQGGDGEGYDYYQGDYDTSSRITTVLFYNMHVYGRDHVL